ncbi:MAG: CpsD/CapB family tyrosine-protein kinase [Desulfobacterales bacterium]|nr:CpsD/CapB family tyrosine-protein kinase [Desulfobacterales bacterium]
MPGHIKKVGFDNLDVLPTGTIPPNPAELLGSQGMQAFLAESAGIYDHIIIDSAPLLGLADAVVLSTKVDGLIYTVHSGVVSKDNLREGIKRLRRVRAPLLGAILNYVDMNSKEYGYYGQYYYSYEDSAEEKA